MATGLVLSPVLFSQTPAPRGNTEAAALPRTSEGKPDLSGVWASARGGGRGGRFTMEDPPLQPWAREMFLRNREGIDPDETGRDDRDPMTFCFPLGPTRNMLLRQFKLYQLPDEILLLFEWDNAVRRIFLDGRAHPPNWPFGWMGHSTGKWDGDTLAVDTVGLNDQTWLDRAGTPHSDALHVVERLRRVDQNTLEIEFWFEDPKAFTRPWGVKRTYRTSPELEVLEHVACEENLKIDPNVKTQDIHN